MSLADENVVRDDEWYTLEATVIDGVDDANEYCVLHEY